MSSHVESLGNFIRTQRRLANLTLREMAELAKVSNPYLSQVERGLHEPSVRVLRSIAAALNMSAETLLAQAGLLDAAGGTPGAATAARKSDDGRPTEAGKTVPDNVKRTAERTASASTPSSSK